MKKTIFITLLFPILLFGNSINNYILNLVLNSEESVDKTKFEKLFKEKFAHYNSEIMKFPSNRDFRISITDSTEKVLLNIEPSSIISNVYHSVEIVENALLDAKENLKDEYQKFIDTTIPKEERAVYGAKVIKNYLKKIAPELKQIESFSLQLSVEAISNSFEKELNKAEKFTRKLQKESIEEVVSQFNSYEQSMEKLSENISKLYQEQKKFQLKVEKEVKNLNRIDNELSEKIDDILIPANLTLSEAGDFIDRSGEKIGKISTDFTKKIDDIKNLSLEQLIIDGTGKIIDKNGKKIGKVVKRLHQIEGKIIKAGDFLSKIQNDFNFNELLTKGSTMLKEEISALTNPAVLGKLTGFQHNDLSSKLNTLGLSSEISENLHKGFVYANATAKAIQVLGVGSKKDQRQISQAVQLTTGLVSLASSFTPPYTGAITSSLSLLGIGGGGQNQEFQAIMGKLNVIDKKIDILDEKLNHIIEYLGVMDKK